MGPDSRESEELGESELESRELLPVRGAHRVGELFCSSGESRWGLKRGG